MLNKNDVEKIYNLANLRLKDEEVEDLAIKYQKVLDFA
ncbi:MAG: Asp-tRNA(Asn)/Glu-tRNA(Gln) amidotransferase GatCAB subunit C, partial [Tissierellia bacterium]|nr:Asp-tRNA(Asn)/Glu-tRNA(Gln) amidotransferase GatCAB subunit C [Tissierellia bacterium]